MAQSPEQFGELSAGSDYLKGWNALGALIAQGHSFSGRERNCAFLNLGESGRRSAPGAAGFGTPVFACASGALGLDQIDDSRCIIPVDWDGDGDLDLWYANRTGPRLRFLRNEIDAGSHWIALKLEGRSGNRDAIGARAELTLTAPDGRTRTLWRRLRAGDGFLSQTPKTLHFGFLPGETINRLVVRWPGPAGPTETIASVQPGQVFKVTEGAGAQSIPASPAPIRLEPGAAVAPDSSAQARIPLVSRMPVPKLEYVDFQARPQSIGGGDLDQPTLVLLWASWCAPCLKEMKELASQAADLKARHIRLVALSVDTASPGATAADLAAAKRTFESLSWPFDAGVTHEGTLRGLALLESRALYPERPLPLPSSYLIDPKGRLAVIYHGPVAVRQLTQDAAFAAHPPESLEAMKMAVFPFPGRDAKPLFPLSAPDFAQALREAGYRDDARDELRRQLKKLAGEPKPDPAAAAAVWWRLADLEDESGRPDESVAAYQKAIALTPNDAALQLAQAATLWRANRKDEATAAFDKARSLAKGASAFQLQIGRVWQTLGEHGRARDAFAASVAAAPGDLESLFNLAVARQLSGDSPGAVADYEAVLRKKPDLLDAASNLSWVLATSRNPKIRQPARALDLAGQVNAAARGRSPAVLDNLAAAHAATGDFAAAVTTAQSALSLANAMSETTLAADITRHLASYRAHKPWIE